MKRIITLMRVLPAALPLAVLMPLVQCTEFKFDNPLDERGTNYNPPEPDKPTTPTTDPDDGGGYTGSYGSVTHGGKTYKTVKIGIQTWMAENLNYDVPNVTTDVCYNNSNDNCNKYGRLYNWETAKAACPSGWHLPSDAEWTVLTDYVGGSSTAGTKLKSSQYWQSYSGVPAGTDSYGFSALPGGRGNSDGSFDYAGNTGYWWSATENDAGYAWHQLMYYEMEYVYGDRNDKTNLFSVRCVED